VNWSTVDESEESPDLPSQLRVAGADVQPTGSLTAYPYLVDVNVVSRDGDSDVALVEASLATFDCGGDDVCVAPHEVTTDAVASSDTTARVSGMHSIADSF
jgi:hypothetical protein